MLLPGLSTFPPPPRPTTRVFSGDSTVMGGGSVMGGGHAMGGGSLMCGGSVTSDGSLLGGGSVMEDGFLLRIIMGDEFKTIEHLKEDYNDDAIESFFK